MPRTCRQTWDARSRSRRRLVRAAGVVLGTIIASRPASADRRIAVESTSAECVPSDRLEAAVAARGVRVDPNAPIELRVSTAPTKDGIAIDVVGRNERGGLPSRSITASSCAEAIDAVALLVAMAAEETPPPSREENAPAPTTTTALTTTPPDRSRGTVSVPGSIDAALGVVGTSFAEGQLGARAMVGLSAHRTLVPWAEIGAVATLPRTVSGGGGDASITWLGARVAVAPLGLELGGATSLSVYGAFETAAILATGSGPAKTESRTRPWLAAAAGARGRIELGARWFLDLEAGAKVPIFRDEFIFVRGGAVYRVPAGGVESAVALGVHFR